MLFYYYELILTIANIFILEASGDEIGQSSGQESNVSNAIEGAEPESDQQAPADDNADGTYNFYCFVIVILLLYVIILHDLDFQS